MTQQAIYETLEKVRCDIKKSPCSTFITHCRNEKKYKNILITQNLSNIPL